MYKAFKFRIYPNSNQEILINKTFGCYRYIYNYFLNKIKNTKYIKVYDMCKEIKVLANEYDWLKEVDSCALRCAVFNLEDAFKSFFNKIHNYPTFKNKYSKQSYRTTCIRSSYKGKEYSNIDFLYENNKRYIKLPKLGNILIKGYRNLNNIPGRIINATISKETTGKYYVSVVVETNEYLETIVKPKSIIGIDLGIKDLVITSNGEKYENIKSLQRNEKRLKRLYRKLSRQEKHSNNFMKTKKKIARLHCKIANMRKFNIINIVNKIVRENDIIVSEKLNTKGMLKEHKLAKNISDASFNKICNMISWKSKLLGKEYIQVDTFYPSSKTCSHCGELTDITNNLNIRKWECPNCYNLNDRDINASINIMFEGLQIYYKKLYN